MAPRDYDLWAEASLTDNQRLADTLPILPAQFGNFTYDLPAWTMTDADWTDLDQWERTHEEAAS